MRTAAVRFASRRSAHASAIASAIAIAIAAGVAGLGCVAPPPANSADQVNRLAGRPTTTSPGVERADRIADGTLAPVGDLWNTGLTAILPSSEAFITVDLGQEMPIAAAFIQADNNDRYLLSGSLDGTSFSTLWEAPAVRGSGVRVRKTDTINGRARYLRLSATGGDGAYSVSELQVYSAIPTAWPEPPAGAASSESSPLTQWILFFGGASVLFLLLGCHGSAQRAVVTAVVPVGAAGLLFAALSGPHAFTDRDVSLLRVITAAVAALAVVRPFLLRNRGWVVDGRRITALLGGLAFVAVACFFNLGRAQFYDAKLRKPSYVHNYDMRVYFPVAKYFHELRYDGLYLASVEAYIENTPGASVRSLANVELRDLRTHEMRRVGEVADEIQTVSQRFSPARWDEFKRDMRYFHETMGRDYITTLTDHGGNATPVWLMVAHAMFAQVSASNGVLIATGLLDPLLVLLLAFVIGRTFGARTAFVSLIVFGANDFYMFGTDWAGATLRNDWMVALGLGVCALKVHRWYLGGALLAYAGLIRAFPAVAVFGLAVPPVWWLFDQRRAQGRWPSLRVFASAHAGTLRALAGAAAAVVVLVALSSAVLSPSAWIGWAHKATTLASGYHVNHISYHSLVSTDYETWELLDGWTHSFVRVALYALGIAGIGVLVLRAARDRPPHQAALLAMFLIPVAFYAANYYFHYVFLLPLLAVSDGNTLRDARIWALLLAMCVAEYAAVMATSLSAHFVTESMVLMATFLALLIVLNREQPGEGGLAELAEEPV